MESCKTDYVLHVSGCIETSRVCESLTTQVESMLTNRNGRITTYSLNYNDCKIISGL